MSVDIRANYKGIIFKENESAIQRQPNLQMSGKKLVIIYFFKPDCYPPINELLHGENAITNVSSIMLIVIWKENCATLKS